MEMGNIQQVLINLMVKIFSLSTICFFMACSFESDTDSAPSDIPLPSPEPTLVSENLLEIGQISKVVKITNKDQGGSGVYEFSPSELNFNVGEAILFEMTAEKEFHTFPIDEIEIDEVGDGGQTTKFQISFDRPGVFRFYCIPHEAFGMVGTITVEE